MTLANTHIDVATPYEYNSKQIPGTVGIPYALWPQFQELVQRGANLWPDASPAIKEFADRVTNGKVMQDYYSDQLAKGDAKVLGSTAGATTSAINFVGVEPDPVQEQGWNFSNAIAQFNEMYQMPSNKWDAPSMMKERLEQFKKMILDEVSEIDLILDKLDKVMAGEGIHENDGSRMEIMTDLADLLGDIQVFCASEMQRFDLPLDAVLQIIMESNASKLQADGTALFVAGKLQKGPNYWKPEPKIEEMLRTYWTQV